MSRGDIHLLLADVDGTLVTQDKVLTDQSIEAVRKLKAADIIFAITSGRPPRGMSMLIDPLDLRTPIAAFNGGVIVDRAMKVIEQQCVPSALVTPIADLMHSFKLDVWIYSGSDWYVPDLKGSHVDREAWTVKFEPILMNGIAGLTEDVAKIVGVSDDHDAVTQASESVHQQFGDHVSAVASQPYYLDVTHPDANKGWVCGYLAKTFDISTDQIATIGDMPNDMLMFAKSGLSIAMGNSSPEVQASATYVTSSNEEEGFAKAVEQFILDPAG